MIQRVLIVCVGNICRSPTAEVVMRARLQRRGIEVESAGLAALVGNPIDPLAESVLGDHGLSAASHSARQISPALIASADVVLAMQKRHLSALHAIAPHARGKTFLLTHWQDNAEVPDPYGRERAAFEQAYRLIDQAVRGWCGRL
jgi:protein-tyrosine phosphatase